MQPAEGADNDNSPFAMTCRTDDSKLDGLTGSVTYSATGTRPVLSRTSHRGHLYAVCPEHVLHSNKSAAAEAYLVVARPSRGALYYAPPRAGFVDAVVRVFSAMGRRLPDFIKLMPLSILPT